MSSLLANDTWDWIPSPLCQNIVGCEWVYKLNYHSDGSIERYKVQLVAQGFHEQAGIDYHETFSPLIKLVIVRLLLSLAVSFG